MRAAADPATGSPRRADLPDHSYVFDAYRARARRCSTWSVPGTSIRVSPNPTVAVLEERRGQEGGVGAVATPAARPPLHLAIRHADGGGRTIVASARIYGGSTQHVHRIPPASASASPRRWPIPADSAQSSSVRSPIRDAPAVAETLGNPGVEVLDIKPCQMCANTGVPL
jgi:O-acetylhomoserine (thiol)-lyase